MCREEGLEPLLARNWTKFWTKFFNPARFSIPDRGRTESPVHPLDGVEAVLDALLVSRPDSGSHSPHLETPP